MEDVTGLKLYHAQIEWFTSETNLFLVAKNEEQVKDVVWNMYGKSFSKNDIHVEEIEVDGYTIQVIPNPNK